MDIHVGRACLILIGIVHLMYACDDLDHQACLSLAAKTPNLCSDEAIASSVCPKYCNRCPIRCYNCNSTLFDYHLCSTTITCQSDEVCMRRELRSYLDGHEEFEMTCAKKTFCDNPWQGVSMFGREIKSRDISVSCCATDLCNYPTVSTTTMSPPPPTTSTTTTTAATIPGCTGCCKDLMIVVDGSNSFDPDVVKQFIKNIVSLLPIGSTETLVSLGMFTSTGHNIFDIGDHVTKSSTLEAISNVVFHKSHGYASVGVSYLLEHAITTAGGDRPNYPNIALILTDDPRTTIDPSDYKVQALQSRAAHVIAVDVNQAHHQFLASSPQYYFHVDTQARLQNVYYNIANLICPLN